MPGACPALRPALAVGLAADSPGVLAAGTALALVPRQRMRGGDQGRSLVYGIKNVIYGGYTYIYMCVCMYVCICFYMGIDMYIYMFRMYVHIIWIDMKASIKIGEGIMSCQQR